MPDQPASHGSNNPRNNPRQHKKPTRRHPGAPAPTSVPHAHGAAAPQPQSTAAPSGYQVQPAPQAPTLQQESVAPREQPAAAAQPQDPRLREAQPYQPHDYQPPQPQPQPHQASSPHGYAGYAAQVPPRVVPATKADGQVAP